MQEDELRARPNRLAIFSFPGDPFFPINSNSSARVTALFPSPVFVPSVRGTCRYKFSSAFPHAESQGQIIYSSAATPFRGREGGTEKQPHDAWPIVMQIEVTAAAGYRGNFD